MVDDAEIGYITWEGRARSKIYGEVYMFSQTEPPMAAATLCSVDGCQRGRRRQRNGNVTSQYCSAHAQRVWTKGHPGPAEIRKYRQDV